jgi:4-hydroxy-tetrahydrodipicolinate synthase
MNLETCRSHLTGPIPSIRTPFLQSGEIDFDGLHTIVDRLLAEGFSTLMLTAGDSHYKCLSDQEIVEVTKAVCRQARGKAFIIGADREHNTRDALRFAEEFKKLGVDLFMAQPPDWAHSTTPETLAAHYQAIGQVLPVMIVTNIFIARGAEFGLKIIRATLDADANVLAIKDDMLGTFAEDLGLYEHHRLALVAGGQKRHHLHLVPFGVDGYLSTMAAFCRREIVDKYWTATQSGDFETARAVIREIDAPFFRHVAAYPGGFDACMHGALELRGLAQRWRRAPYYSLSDREMEQLAAFLTSIGVL